MLYNCISIYAVFLFITICYAIRRPSFIAACHRNDPEIDKCAIESAKVAIPELAKGDAVYQIPNLKPMHIDSIDLEPSGNIRLFMQNITVHGLDLVQPTNFKIDLKNKQMTFEVFTPYLEITGHYKITGHILILPIEGQGKGNITFVDAHFRYPMRFELVKRKNIEYIRIREHTLTFVCKRAYYYFQNLFNGNKALGDQMMTFLDENWEIVNKDLGPIVAQAIDSIVTSIANSILGRVPYDDVFLP